jgi:hypothetical protein
LSGINVRGEVRFTFAPIDTNLRLADAWLEFPSDSRISTGNLPTLWVLYDEIMPCDTNHPGLMPIAKFLGNASRSTTAVRFITDPFAFHVQARIWRIPLLDYALNSGSSVTYNAFAPTSGIHLVYYRLPAGAAARSGAGAR